MSAEEKLCLDLDGYLAEDLNEEQKNEFEAHLQSCGNCWEEVEIERNLDAVLSRVPDAVEIPVSLDAVFSTRIRKERKKEFYRRGLLATATLLLLGFFSILVFNNKKPTDRIGDFREDRTIKKETSPVEYKLYDPSESVAKILLKDPKKTIVVEYPTESKNITMVFLYPVEPQPQEPQKNKQNDTSLE